MVLYWCWPPLTTKIECKMVNMCHNFQWACFTTMCSLHSLASLVHHSVSETEDSLKESSVGQEKQQKLQIAKLNLDSARLCIMGMTVNLPYQYSTIQRQAKHKTCWQHYSILAPLHCVTGVWKRDWNLSKTNSTKQWVKAELTRKMCAVIYLNKSDCRINRLLLLSSSSCMYICL